MRKRVLLVQPSLQPPGGGNAVAVWMIEALKRVHDVSVLTLVAVDVAPINRFYGTTLARGDFRALRVPPVLQWTADLLDPDSFDFLKMCLLLRHCQVIRDRFDVVLSAQNELDLGGPSVQYVHQPWLAELHRRMQAARGRRPRRPWQWISRFSFERMKRNLTLVNSAWTGRRFEAVYGATTRTLYPPVPDDFPLVPWERKRNAFVCIGRISGEKRYEEVVEILGLVRAAGHDVRLEIVGSRTPDLAYRSRLHRCVDAHRSWVTLHEDLPRPALAELVAGQRYGIHGMRREHFGIAVAEMVRAGAIPFVPDDGGQVEIVGRDERLSYGSAEEAAAKIVRVLEDSGLQAEILERLRVSSEAFSTARFVEEIRGIVDDW